MHIYMSMNIKVLHVCSHKHFIPTFTCFITYEQVTSCMDWSIPIAHETFSYIHFIFKKRRWQTKENVTEIRVRNTYRQLYHDNNAL